MSISLTKGQRVSLTKDHPSLQKVLIGLSWDANRYDGEADFDLDLSAFLCDATGKCTKDSDFVFYGQLRHPSGAVIHSGDNRTGDADGDDETMVVDLSKIPANCDSIVFVATIYDAASRMQNFGMVDNAAVHAVDEQAGEELCRFDLSESFSSETAVTLCQVYRHDGEWKFRAVGSGYIGGLAALCAQYGIDAS